MARITVEDCLKRVDNRFGLIHLAAKRVRQLRKGSEPLVKCKNKDVVVALREIASGDIYQSPGAQGSALENQPEIDAPELPEIKSLEAETDQEEKDVSR